MTTIDTDAHDALRAQIAATSVTTLIASLATLCASVPLDEAGRLVRSLIVDDLTDRLPALMNAVDSWIEDDDTPFDTSADAVLNALSTSYVVTFARGPITEPGALGAQSKNMTALELAVLATYDAAATHELMWL